MKIKEDSILFRDMKISGILLFVAVWALVSAILFEFNSHFVCEHKDFIINVLLGLAASSSISFICVFCPAKSKRDHEIRDITEDCINILMGYKTIISQIALLFELSGLGHDPQADSLYLKRVVLDRSDDLIDNIKTLTESYRRGEIESKEVTRLLEKYNKGLCGNLETIKSYFDAIFSLANINFADEGIIHLARYERVMNSSSSILLRILEEDCPSEDLEKALKDAFPERKNIDLEHIRHLQENLTQSINVALDNIEDTKKLLKEYKIYSIVRGEWAKDQD